jgi:hypothetical protein
MTRPCISLCLSYTTSCASRIAVTWFGNALDTSETVLEFSSNTRLMWRSPADLQKLPSPGRGRIRSVDRRAFRVRSQGGSRFGRLLVHLRAPRCILRLLARRTIACGSAHQPVAARRTGRASPSRSHTPCGQSLRRCSRCKRVLPDHCGRTPRIGLPESRGIGYIGLDGAAAGELCVSGSPEPKPATSSEAASIML